MWRPRTFWLCAAMALVLGNTPTHSEPPAKKVLDGRFPLSAEESGAAWRAEPGFRAEVFAAEPHLASPVGMTFDADGDVYVAEMLDYPIIRTPGMFGPFPEGQIRLLRTDDRGKVVRSTVFAGAINAPTSVVPYDGGVLVAAAPDILFFKDNDGDGHADVRQVILTGFDAGQDLYRLNSLLWGVDGWIYARGVGNTPIHWGDDLDGPALSTEGMDFRFKPAEKKLEPVTGMSSCFGLTMDDWGHRFFSNSANHIYQAVLPNHYLRRNPYLSAPSPIREISDHGGVAQVTRISEPQAWRVERSKMWEKEGLTKKFFGTIEPRQDYMTSTCGPKVYRESAFPAEYLGNYFVCEAVGNLVHRDVLKGPGPVYTASRGSEGREFLASADPWCSPVSIETGPDGGLYVVDMYRQVIEHAGADGGRDVPNVPLEILNKYGLRAGSTMGRIYRVLPEKSARWTKPRLSQGSPKVLAATLASPDAWWRTTAQRLILGNPKAADREGIAAVARAGKVPAARVQALWTLEGLGVLDGALILDALKHPTPGVRENALRLAEPRLASDPALAEAVAKMTDDPDASVRFQLAFTLGELPGAVRLEALARVARLGARDADQRTAALSSVGDDGLALYRMLADGDSFPGVDNLLADLARLIGARLEPAEIGALLGWIDAQKDDRAGALASLAAGIKQRGQEPLNLPNGREALKRLLASPEGDLRSAADALAAHVRILTDAQRKEALDKALALLKDDTLPVDDRVQAAGALGNGDLDAIAETLAELLHPRQPEPLQFAALKALDGQSGLKVIEILAEAWKGLTPALRARAAEVALGRKERLAPLLEAIHRGEIPADAIDAPRRAGLLGSPDPAIARAAKEALGDAGPKLDPRKFEAFRGALELIGDAGRGAVIFKARCTTCHKAGEEGREVGPNLVSVKDHTREQTLKDIVYPSLLVAPQHVQYVVETANGQLYSGLLASSNASSLTIRRPGEPDLTLLRKDVEALSNTQTSLMPENLLDGLKDREVADLLEFVKGIGR